MLKHAITHRRLKAWRNRFGPIAPDGAAANQWAVVNYSGLLLQHCEEDHGRPFPVPSPKSCESWSLDDWHQALHEDRVPVG